MKINFINKGKLKKIASYALVGGMLLSPMAAVAESYVVQPGDTLTGISQRKYGTISYSDELAYLNSIENENYIRAGQVLYLPDDIRELDFCGQDDYGYVDNIIYHTFTDTDTLWRLARDYYGNGEYWKPLAYFNGITNPRKIRTGREIMIPPFSYLDLRAMNMTFEGEDDKKEEFVENQHVFNDPDTLWKIAKDNYGSGNYWEALAIYNNIDDPKKIANGLIIYLPSIDTLNEIRVGNYSMDLYTMSKKYYGTSKYASILAGVNNILNYGVYNPSTMFFPSADDMRMYFENNTFANNDGYYVVKRNDTIKKIALLVYEDENYANMLLEVNGINKKDIKEGTVLYIPSIYNVYTK